MGPCFMIQRVILSSRIRTSSRRVVTMYIVSSENARLTLNKYLTVQGVDGNIHLLNVLCIYQFITSKLFFCQFIKHSFKETSGFASGHNSVIDGNGDRDNTMHRRFALIGYDRVSKLADANDC